MNDLTEHLKLYLVADPDQTSRDLIADVRAALAGGVTAVQLRVKRGTDRAILDLARTFAAACRDHDALFLVNDRVDIALAAAADGVHLGVDDLPLRHARTLLGPSAVIGFSPETDQQAAEARCQGADYLGIGPVFATMSKGDAGTAIGVVTLQRRTGLAGIPVIGIGGISATNATDVIHAGAVGVAVISAILGAPDPSVAARELSAAVRRGAK